MILSLKDLPDYKQGQRMNVTFALKWPIIRPAPRSPDNQENSMKRSASAARWLALALGDQHRLPERYLNSR
jgi:hypothetical protein